MAFTVSKNTLANRALAHLGEKTVTDITIDSNKGPRVLNGDFDLAGEAFMAEENWNWSLGYALLVASTPATPEITTLDTYFDYVYALPGDFNRFLAWSDKDGTPPTVWRIIGANTLGCDSSEVYLWYARLFSSSFTLMRMADAEAFTLFLASRSAMMITANTKLAQLMNNKYRIALASAVKRNREAMFVTLTEPDVYVGEERE